MLEHCASWANAGGTLRQRVAPILPLLAIEFVQCCPGLALVLGLARFRTWRSPQLQDADLCPGAALPESACFESADEGIRATWTSFNFSIHSIMI